jgi:hypothetical protein
VAIDRYVGTWAQAINEALPNLEMGTAWGPTKYSEAYLVEAYVTCWNDLGREPSGRQYMLWARGHGERPGMEVIRRRLGGGLWSAVPERMRELRGES